MENLIRFMVRRDGWWEGRSDYWIERDPLHTRIRSGWGWREEAEKKLLRLDDAVRIAKWESANCALRGREHHVFYVPKDYICTRQILTVIDGNCKQTFNEIYNALNSDCAWKEAAKDYEKTLKAMFAKKTGDKNPAHTPEYSVDKGEEKE